ncbi:MAG: hypothetical protein ABIW34_03145 [Ginsengibacter sp.]
MRKIFVITMLLFFSLFLKNEKAICKTNCKINAESSCNKKVNNAVLNTDNNTDEIANQPKQYDGFFFKI